MARSEPIERQIPHRQLRIRSQNVHDLGIEDIYQRLLSTLINDGSENQRYFKIFFYSIVFVTV